VGEGAPAPRLGRLAGAVMIGVTATAVVAVIIVVLVFVERARR
jgi:hypothetical protein